MERLNAINPAMVEFLRNVASVILGWALGLGSASYTEWRKGRKRARAIKIAISLELREIALRLLMLAQLLERRTGGLNRKTLEWMLPLIQRYAGPNPKDELLAGVEGLLRSSDAELAQLAEHLQKTTPPSFIPHQEVSYTTTAVGQLHDQDPEYAARILDILSHIRMFNDARENGLYYLRLTFAPGLTDANHQKAIANVLQTEAQLAKRARIIVEKISSVEDKFPQNA